MILNKTPVRTSKNFGINEIDLKLENTIKEFDNITILGDTEKFNITDKTSNINLKYGIGKVELANQKKKIIINGQEQKELFLDFEFNEENKNLVDDIEIELTQNSNATIYIKYISDKVQNYYHNGTIRVLAKENSKVNLCIVNMLNKKSDNLISIENTVYNNSNVEYTIVDFGGKNSISNCYSNIIGENAVCNLNTIYLGSGNQFIDINYISELKGKNSNTNIEVQGALADNAKKNFKGTIDFKKGCKKAKGNENEFCMMLSENARAKALPMLLCTEEDVEGNHSTSSGKIEKEKLFYIMSRGFSYKETMKLIVKASFNNIIEKIKDKALKNMILDKIDETI